MSTAPPSLVPVETARNVSAFSRALVAATRARQLYTAEHPATSAAAVRLQAVMADLCAHSGLEIGVAPKTLLANGEPLPPDQRMTEASALLHERDVLRLRVREVPAVHEVGDFLNLLHFDGNALRQQGGPARVWDNFGYRWLELDQIDYDSILKDAPEGASGRPGQHATGKKGADSEDDVWTSLVRSIAGGREALGSKAKKRLLDIAKSAESIKMLASEAGEVDPGCSGAVLAAAQAAAILATFDRIINTVREQAPDDLSVAVKNVAKAASELDPEVAMRVIGESAESGIGLELCGTLGSFFDDNQIATMLARSLAAEGRASGRMAAALNTLAPDEDRRDRVMRLARSMNAPAESESGLESTWKSLKQFMSGPADNLYVSDGYSASLEHAESRSQQLRLDVPAELDGWIQSVSSESVRTLSVTLMLDLFAQETESAAITETANDLAALACDLLLSADLDEALRIATALRETGSSGKSVRALAARLALESISTSEALAELMPMAGDLDAPRFQVLVDLCRTVGTGVLRVTVASYADARRDETRLRLRQLVAAFGEAGITTLGRLVADEDWEIGRTAIQLMGLSGEPSALTLLQPLVNDADLQKAREAIVALLRFNDPAAAKAISRAMAVGNRQLRTVAVEALAASRDRRASPLLAGLLSQINALGADWELATRTLAALRVVADDSAIDGLAGVCKARRWFARRRMRSLRKSALDVLLQLRTPAATAAIDTLARHGDWQARRMARAALRGAD